MLKIVDIHTYYGESYVLQGISLEVGARTVVALLETAERLFDQRTSGVVRFLAKNTNSLSGRVNSTS